MDLGLLYLKSKDILDFTKPCSENMITGMGQSTICFMKCSSDSKYLLIPA